MLKKFGLQKYLLVVVFGVIFISFVSSLFTISYIQKSIDELMSASQRNNNESLNIIELSISISSIHSGLSPLITEKDPDVLETSVAKLQQKMKDVSSSMGACQIDCNKIELINKAYQKKVNELIDKKILLGKTAEAIEYFIQDISPLYLEILNDLEHKGSEIKASAINSILKSKEQATQLKYAIITSSVLMVVIIAFGGFSFRKSLVSALTLISQRLDGSTITLNETSMKVASTSDFLSESSSKQNSSIQGTSQAVQEITHMTDINRNNVKVSSENAQKSQSKITEGKKAISEMIESIDLISKSNAEMVEQINRNDQEFTEVVNVILAIDEKTKVINDIVFQTKLLSFNASVESARAGEHGKGFAVVAEEIGNLALMSGQAANEISELLNSSVKRVNDIVKKSQSSMVLIVDSGKTTIKKGNENASNCNVIFDQISVESQNICNILEEINGGIHEQSKGIEEVNKAMLELNDVANKNENVAQESLETSSKLNEQAESLGNVVKDLSVLINGRQA